MMSSKAQINEFLDNFLQNVNNHILKYLCKFQVDTPKNAKAVAVQSLGNLCTHPRTSGSL